MNQILKTWVVTGLWLLTALACGQSPNLNDDVPDPIDQLRATYDAKMPAKTPVLVLGVFHFQGSSADERSIDDIDMLADERQQQIEEVLTLLKAFQPTKIAVEVKRNRQAALDETYQSYLVGGYELTAGERDQLGFRLARQLGHDQVHAIDADGRRFESETDSETLAAATGQQLFLTDPVDEAWNAMEDLMDSWAYEKPLVEYLRILNHPGALQLSHSIYLTRDRAITDGEQYPSADGFISHWYNRNIRIFGNILGLAESENDRILVIIGAGHAPIVNHLIQNAGGLELVDVSTALGGS